MYERVLEVVRQIPRGQVATYGQIAQIVGDCTPRMVGFCLASLGRYPDDQRPDVPWQRVINAQGKISPRGEGLGALLQRELLEAEGVEFSDTDRVSFRRFGWLDPYEGEEESLPVVPAKAGTQTSRALQSLRQPGFFSTGECNGGEGGTRTRTPKGT